MRSGKRAEALALTMPTSETRSRFDVIQNVVIRYSGYVVATNYSP